MVVQNPNYEYESVTHWMIDLLEGQWMWLRDVYEAANRHFGTSNDPAGKRDVHKALRSLQAAGILKSRIDVSGWPFKSEFTVVDLPGETGPQG